MIDRDEDISKAVRHRDCSRIVRLFFASDGNVPIVRPGFKTEGELWDYKPNVPFLGQRQANAWANVASDILGLHNCRGGLLFFGITDNFQFCGATERLDSKLLNDQLRRYLPDTLWVEFHREYIQEDQRYLGVAIVPQRSGPLVRFKEHA